MTLDEQQLAADVDALSSLIDGATTQQRDALIRAMHRAMAEYGSAMTHRMLGEARIVRRPWQTHFDAHVKEI